ncbi:MAG: hypothetical protein Q9191_003499 [Dirinaria sp. TL-2023a]
MQEYSTELFSQGEPITEDSFPPSSRVRRPPKQQAPVNRCKRRGLNTWCITHEQTYVTTRRKSDLRAFIPNIFPPLSQPHRCSLSTSVKLDPRDTPPPLHHSPATSDLEPASTAEPTPVGTPRAFDIPSRRRSQKEKEKDLLFSWHRRAHGLAETPTSYVDSALLECDFEDAPFPLFGDSMTYDMASQSNAIDIGPTSPRQNQASNLTSALQSTTGNEMRPSQAVSNGGMNWKTNGFGTGHRESRDSLSSGTGIESRSNSGAQPISMNRDKPRRESLAGSMVGGMSWGGVSVSSWVRDE